MSDKPRTPAEPDEEFAIPEGVVSGKETAARDGTVLEVSGITKAYGGMMALKGIDLSLRPGEVVALLGLNGAGKSTLIKILSGVEQPTDGTMRLSGRGFRPKAPADAAAAGLKVVHQHRTLIPHLTVAENVLLGDEPAAGGLIATTKLTRRVADLARDLHVPVDPRANIDGLGAGERQMVDILKSLRSPGSVLLLDEPTAALSNHERETLFSLIASLRDSGLAILFVSHQLTEVFRICDRIISLRDGRVVSDRKTAESRLDDVVADIVGEENVSAFSRETNTNPGDTVVEVRSTRPGEIGMNVHSGEVVGLAGSAGSGCTELIEYISGSNRVSDGRELIIRGAVSDYRNPASARKDHVLLLPEKRQEKGIWEKLSVRENVSLGNLDRSTRGWFTRRRSESKLVKTLTGPLNISMPSMSAKISALSGGNQQKVVFARVAGQAQNRDGAVFCFDEPTEGVDVRTKPEIALEICALADEGAAVIVASSDLEELIEMTDRVYVLREGTIVAQIESHSRNRDRIVASMLADTPPEAGAAESALAAS